MQDLLPASDPQSDADIELSSSASSTGGDYFDGMPGRVLGGGVDTLVSKDTKRSHIAVGDRDNTVVAESLRPSTTRQGDLSGKPTATSAAALLRLERDKRERAAWAQRIGAGRPHPRKKLPQQTSSTMDSPASLGVVQASAPRGDDSSDLRENTTGEHGRQNTGTSLTKRGGGISVSGEGAQGDQYEDDPVARAFERYALHRHREEEKRRASPLGTSKARVIHFYRRGRKSLLELHYGFIVSPLQKTVIGTLVCLTALARAHCPVNGVIG